MNETIGAITFGQGRRAIARNVPGSEKLFLCESFTCPICGGVEHGTFKAAHHLSLVNNEYQQYQGLVKDQCDVCGTKMGMGEGRHHCAFCDRHIPLPVPTSFTEQHYHLGA